MYMLKSEPAPYFRWGGDPENRWTRTYEMPFAFAVAATAVGTAVATTTAATVAVAAVAVVSAAAVAAGWVMTIVGAVTGDKDLMRIGGVVGLAGGIASWATSAASASMAAATSATSAATAATPAASAAAQGGTTGLSQAAQAAVPTASQMGMNAATPAVTQAGSAAAQAAPAAAAPSVAAGGAESALSAAGGQTASTLTGAAESAIPSATDIGMNAASQTVGSQVGTQAGTQVGATPSFFDSIGLKEITQIGAHAVGGIGQAMSSNASGKAQARADRERLDFDKQKYATEQSNMNSPSTIKFSSTPTTPQEEQQYNLFRARSIRERVDALSAP